MDSRKTSELLRERKTYKKPTLMTYGQLKDLTAGGSGTANEGSAGKKPRP